MKFLFISLFLSLSLSSSLRCALPCSPSSLSSHFLSFLISLRLLATEIASVAREAGGEKSSSLPSSSFSSLSLFLSECLSLSHDEKEFGREENREDRRVPLLSLSPARSLSRRKLFPSREEFSSLPLLPSFSLFISLFSLSRYLSLSPQVSSP